MASRAIGIVRQSKGNEDALSPAEQRKRIEDACQRDGMKLVSIHEEIDVSGGTALTKRKGLSAAVEAIEGGKADVVMVAYFDRLVRSLNVQGEVTERVEAAGGKVLALDFGRVGAATAAQWIASTSLGMVAEYHRRTTRERSAAAQAMAVARGVRPWPDVPFGYDEGEDGVLVPDPETKQVVLEAFRLRASGASIRAVWEHLEAHGFAGNYGSAQRLLGNKIYLGEIHFGELVNPTAHDAIVPRELFHAVQRVRVPRGRQPKSPRLLARLGVLRCGGCGGLMGASTAGDGKGGKVPVYRCPGTTAGTCGLRAQVSAPIAEQVVVDAVKARHADATGRASAERTAREAVEAAEQAQADLDGAIRVLGGVEDEPAAIERLAELRRARDEARERAEHLGGLRSGLTLRLADDWNRLSIEGQRDAIRATVARAVVGPGRGAERISVELLV